MPCQPPRPVLAQVLEGGRPEHLVAREFLHLGRIRLFHDLNSGKSVAEERAAVGSWKEIALNQPPVPELLAWRELLSAGSVLPTRRPPMSREMVDRIRREGYW